MKQIIQLKPEDDIASIRAKIDTAELSHLVLVVPRGCAALDREPGMRMLRRAADDSAAQVALVVHDDDVRDRAEMFGLPTFNSLAQAQRTPWKMRSLAPDAIQDSLNPLPPESVARVALNPADLFRRWGGTISVLVIASFVICIIAVLFVPTANVHIVPSSVALTMTTNVLLDASLSQVSSELRAIPTRRLLRQINSTGQLKTTTTKNLPDVRSTGTVIFTNLRSDETTIPPDTVVRTSAGVPIRFTTVTTATVPAGINSRVEAPIVAVDPGLSGNVKELAVNTVDGSLSLEVRVINLKPTVSGTLKATRIVTADDKKKLETQLLQQLNQQGTDLLQQDLQPGEFLAPDSITIDTDTETFDHAVDDPADTLNLRISATAFGLAVDRADLELIAKTFLQKQLQPGYTLLPNGVQVAPQSGGKYNGVLLDMPYRAVGYTTPQIDMNKVAAAVQGKSIGDAKAYLSGAIQLAQPPVINVTPPGWFRMPSFAFRIAVFVEPPPIVSK
jgi:hypothetical protein